MPVCVGAALACQGSGKTVIARKPRREDRDATCSCIQTLERDRAPPGCRFQNVKPQNRKGEATEKEDRAATLLRLWLALRCSAKTVNAWQSWPSGSAQSRFARSEDFDEAGPSIPPLRCQGIEFERYWSPRLLIRLALHFQLDQTQRETKEKKAARSGSARGPTARPAGHIRVGHTPTPTTSRSLWLWTPSEAVQGQKDGRMAVELALGGFTTQQTATLELVGRSPFLH